MPAVARKTDKFKTGHSCTVISTLTGPSIDVFANGLGVERKGDPSVVHTVGSCTPHTVNIASGSSTVFVNDRPIARIGDRIDKDSIISGSPDVFAG